MLHRFVMDLSSGDVIEDKYEIVRLLGRGGMGSVYEGLHRRIHRRVAIKIIHGSIAHHEVALQRFEREAQAAGHIGSRHIVEVIDIGELPTGHRFMVLEFLEGQSLRERMEEEGQLLPEHLFPIVAELLEGLGAAHAAGIVHRDLKPDNIWLCPAPGGRGDFVKILDFGVSKFRKLEALTYQDEHTKTGVVVGTPTYMAPEQARGERDVDGRADIYSVGIILYRCLSGRLPHDAESYNQLIFKLVLEEPEPLDEVMPHLDPQVVAMVMKAMARDRDARYPDTEALRTELVGWLQRQGHPISLAVAGLLQSGDRVGAELLQSGDRVRIEDARTPIPENTETMPASQPPVETPDPGVGSTQRISLDAAQTVRMAPLRDEDEMTTRRVVPPPPDEEVTVERRVPSRPVAALTPASRRAPTLSNSANMAVGIGIGVTAMAVLMGVGLTQSDDDPTRARAHWGSLVRGLTLDAAQEIEP